MAERRADSAPGPPLVGPAAREMDAILEGRPLPRRERVVIPTYADKAREAKEKRKPASIFGTPRPAPSGG